MEHGRMGQIRVAAIDLARSDDRDRRLLGQHGANLQGRGVGAQHHVVRDVERILHVPGRVLGRHVERLEIVVVGLDLRAGDDGEAEFAEGLADLGRDQGHGMQAAAAGSKPGDGGVEPGQGHVLGGPVEGGEPGVVESGQGLLDGVGGAAGLAAAVGVQARQLAHESGQASLAAEVGDADGLKVLKRQGLVEARGALPDQALKLGNERGSVCHLIHLGFGQLRQLLEAVLFLDGHVGQDLAVELHAGQAQAAHEHAVGQAVLASGGVDADDPELAHLALALLAVAEGVHQGAFGDLAGGFVQLAAGSDVALGHGQIFLVPFVGGLSTFDAHGFGSLRCVRDVALGLGVGQQAAHGLHVGRIDQGALAQAAGALGAFLGQDMAQVLTATGELAGTGLAEALGGATVGLHLGHVELLDRARLRRARGFS